MVVEDRATLEAKIRWTKEQIQVCRIGNSFMMCALMFLLQGIRRDLESALDTSKLTSADVIHSENEKLGMDKYKTMKKAQSGVLIYYFCCITLCRMSDVRIE